MKTYTWTTPKGAKVELTVSQSRMEKLNSDGCDYGFEKEEICPMAEKFTVNGKEINIDNSYGMDKVILFKMNGRKCECAIPQEIRTDIQKQTNERISQQGKNIDKLESAKKILRDLEAKA